MAIEIREYLGSGVNISESATNKIIEIKEGYNVINPISKDSIMQEIEGIHVGPTRNFTWYMEEALDSSIPSWTKPYQRPLIMHHNEKDGKIIGRVAHVEKITVNTRSGTPALLFTCNVPDKDGKEQILDGRLNTVSIGVIAHDVRCSICKEQIQLDDNGYPECGHTRGNIYSNEVCYWNIYKMEAKELSYVIVPSDIYAHNTRTYSPENKDINVQESLQLKEGVFKDMAIDKTNLNQQEGQAIDETVKDGEKIAEPKAAEPKVAEPAESKAAEPVEDAEVTALKKEVSETKAENVVLANELKDIKVLLASVTIQVDKVSKDLKTEVELKESAEEQLITAKTELRESTESNLNSLRTALNKPIMTTESLSSRSFESIKDSIADLKEEMTGLAAVRKITESVDPTIKSKENLEKKPVDVKESKSNGNIDLEEGVKKMMANFLL